MLCQGPREAAAAVAVAAVVTTSTNERAWAVVTALVKVAAAAVLVVTRTRSTWAVLHTYNSNSSKNSINVGCNNSCNINDNNSTSNSNSNTMPRNSHNIQWWWRWHSRTVKRPLPRLCGFNSNSNTCSSSAKAVNFLLHQWSLRSRHHHDRTHVRRHRRSHLPQTLRLMGATSISSSSTTINSSRTSTVLLCTGTAGTLRFLHGLPLKVATGTKAAARPNVCLYRSHRWTRYISIQPI